MNLTKVLALIQEKLDACEAFTSACISNPIIEEDNVVRHSQVNSAIKDNWAINGFVGDDDGMQVDYLRTLIDVYPKGPGSSPVKAYCYYPDNGYDPYLFSKNSRVLVRDNDPKVDPTARTFDMDCDDDEDAAVLTNTADGGTVTKQCSVQTKENRLNIPRFIIKAAGWDTGDFVNPVVKPGDIIEIRRTSSPSAQSVDKEGRVRLYSDFASMFDGANCTAALVDDGNEKYIQLTK